MSGLLVFTMIWWVVFFMALPIAIQRMTKRVPGQDPGAPERANVGLKILCTTGISLLVWGIVFWIITMKFVNFRAMAHATAAAFYGP